MPLSGYWNVTTKTYDLGTVDLLSSIPASLMNSMKLTLASWQGVVELHNRMEAPSESVEKIHFDMFINDLARNCVTCYTINFNSIYGSGPIQGIFS
ncbi:hypothetical protein LEP1GSC088_4389 [Leptospira interrogans str. L1207]|nr:hypothetical protein LEP1GSC088_4389 [Leptospira interrogans str. L1207]